MHKRSRRSHAQVAKPKKLIDAGAYWATSRSGRDSTKEDNEWLGLPENYGTTANDDFEVYPENWDALQAFIACATQWRVSGMGDRLGLDYSSLKTVLDFEHPQAKHKTLFHQVRLIEQGALCQIMQQRESHASS